MSDEEELAHALSMSMRAPDEEDGSAERLAEQVAEICGCPIQKALAAVQVAGPGGLELAVELALGDDLPAAATPHVRHKLVCLVRTDLGMGVGKVAAQVAHAVLGAYRAATLQSPSAIEEWSLQGEPTIVLQVPGFPELGALLSAARAQGLVTHMVADAGRTQVASGTETVGCVGPGPADEIDKVTGALSLL